ncbi:MAG: hypothetical protein QF511_08905 [Rhodospirillales bacterium]|jgi:hypothetical protein|nr:hypothetical protein [Rhodospirillales bacterium]HIJ44449.1 hypothetical protein [Rhodospirillaceae bacterium]MDP7214452.1 hypothetical protein [Rhodospirillales bacterium]HIJ45534.1 hypothetical protein [Rhodospirillaceae bacterium]HIJ93897.1 hypothetical protein [Rhodospirillaceae bacterium]
MNGLDDNERRVLSEALSIYATLRLWGLISSYRRESEDGDVLWESPFGKWKKDYLDEQEKLISVAVKLGLDETCRADIEAGMGLVDGVTSIGGLSGRHMHRRLKKWRMVLGERLRRSL